MATRFLVKGTKEIDTGETLECPVCHRLLRLTRLNPSGNHRLKELNELVDKAKEADVDLTLPDHEWILKMKREIYRWFRESIKRLKDARH